MGSYVKKLFIREYPCCPGCGVDLTGFKKKYCSPRCRMRHKRGGFKMGLENAFIVKNDILTESCEFCLGCGVRLTGQQRKYCSPRCRMRYTRGGLKGPHRKRRKKSFQELLVRDKQKKTKADTRKAYERDRYAKQKDRRRVLRKELEKTILADPTLPIRVPNSRSPWCSYCTGLLKEGQLDFCSVGCASAYYVELSRKASIPKGGPLFNAFLKNSLVRMSGGACVECGYYKNSGALVFHHRVPKEKLFSLSADSVGRRTAEDIEKELAKCDLLCHNCHSETHHPELEGLLDPPVTRPVLPTPDPRSGTSHENVASLPAKHTTGSPLKKENPACQAGR